MAHGADAAQTAPKAIEFYNAKVEELNTSLRELEKVVQAKSGNLRVVEDGTLRLCHLPNFSVPPVRSLTRISL